MTAIKIQQFEGPLDLLLSLVESRKLEITEISLADVCDQYVAIVRAKQIPIQYAADYLVIAAKLLYLKSKVLLPTVAVEQDEDDGPPLEEQLRVYQEFVRASNDLASMLRRGETLYEHPWTIGDVLKGFYPPHRATGPVLAELYGALQKSLAPLVAMPSQTVRRIITLEERIETIRQKILEGATLLFSSLVGSSASNVDRIVNFLAILELMKQRIVVLDQHVRFADIHIEPCGASTPSPIMHEHV